jgi:hypothetical protein
MLPAVRSPERRSAEWNKNRRGELVLRFCRAGDSSMPASILETRLTVPYGADQTVYLVVDRFDRQGSVYRETEVERTDLESIISDFISGQFNDPIRVVAFNTLEHWSKDVSGDIADEIQTRCDIEGMPVPEHVRDFVDAHSGPARQLTLRLG